MKRCIVIFCFFISITNFFSCNKEKKRPTLNTLEESTGISFINKVENTKEFNIFTYRNFYNGGGVAIGDINNDSLPDIYFTANQKKNKLYLNKGNFVFEDITDKSRSSTWRPVMHAP